MSANIFDELVWRGLVNQVSDEKEIREYLGRPGAVMYCGFDPTAESLHIGNLVPLLCLVRMKKAGHRPLFLLGGATGRIGDPSGKDKERELNDEARLEAMAARIEAQVRAFFQRNTGEDPDVVNNYDWTRNMTALELLRDIGKHFTINWMMQKDSVKSRLGREDVGISYTEFSYMVLQGMDFWHLYKHRDCRLQIGGGDQWGNITAGTELIRRKEQGHGFALTFPLITTASGAKFGKSAGNAVWMDPEMTSPYAFYQYWVNTDDADVVNFLKYFTFLGQEEIAELAAELAANPGARAAQKRLAAEVTTMIHGQEELDRVLRATDALFGKGDITQVDAKTIMAALGSAPRVEYSGAELPDLFQIMVDLGMAASKGQARKDAKGGGVYVNQERVGDDYAPSAASFIEGRVMLIRKGKKNYGLVVLS
ncbi:MAG: tyrosine--tRNA ligase [Desulfovibrionaceae bacterium]